MRNVYLAAMISASVLVTGCATSSFQHLSNDEKAADYNAELGANYLATGNLENAQIKLRRALEQDPRNALANNTHGKLLAALDDPRGAEKAFLKSIKLDKDRAEYRNNYGIFLCDQNRPQEAVNQFITASQNKFYETPEYALDNAGVCAMDAGLHAVAEKHLRDAVRINSKFPPVMLHMAELKLKTGDAALADAYYSRFLNLSRQTPQSLMVGVNIRRELGDDTAAQQYGRTLISSFPGSRQAQLYLASQ